MNKNEYKSRFWAPKPGKINYLVKINKGVDSYQVSSGAFEVQESHVELNRIYLNKEKLKKISISSGGLFKFWENREELLEKIVLDAEAKRLKAKQIHMGATQQKQKASPFGSLLK